MLYFCQFFCELLFAALVNSLLLLHLIRYQKHGQYVYVFVHFLLIWLSHNLNIFYLIVSLSKPRPCALTFTLTLPILDFVQGQIWFEFQFQKCQQINKTYYRKIVSHCVIYGVLVYIILSPKFSSSYHKLCRKLNITRSGYTYLIRILNLMLTLLSNVA